MAKNKCIFAVITAGVLVSAIILVVVAFGGNWFNAGGDNDDSETAKSCCGDCWCIPEDGFDCPAPTNTYPQMYTNEMIVDFASKELVHPDTLERVMSNNLFEIECNPFDGVFEASTPPWKPYQNSCKLIPEQSFDSTDDPE